MSFFDPQARRLPAIFALDTLARFLEYAQCIPRRFSDHLQVWQGSSKTIIEASGQHVDRAGANCEHVFAITVVESTIASDPVRLAEVADRFGLGYVVARGPDKLEFGCRFPIKSGDVVGQEAVMRSLRARVPILAAAAREALEPAASCPSDDYARRPWKQDEFETAAKRMTGMGVPMEVDPGGFCLTGQVEPPEDKGNDPVLAAPVALRMCTQGRHAIAGPGLKFVTRHDLRGIPAEDLFTLAARLNEFERSGSMAMPTTGAWTVGDDCLLYGGIIPDTVHQHQYIEQIPANLVYRLAWRSRFVLPTIRQFREQLAGAGPKAPLRRPSRGNADAQRYSTNAMAPERPDKQWIEAYTPDEHAVLAKYLGVACAEAGRDIAVEDALVRLEIPALGDLESRVAVAVGQIALAGVSRSLDSHHLFSANWNSGEPGVELPARYQATLLPQYNYVVITDSRGTIESHGVQHVAVGSFPRCSNDVAKAGQVICDLWRHLKEQSGCERPQGVTEEGCISIGQAEALVNQVWQADAVATTDR